MRKPVELSGILTMTREDRLDHIAYYRARAEELHEMGRWIRRDATRNGDTISMRLVVLERTIAMLQDASL